MELNGVQEVAGSNPVAPTITYKRVRTVFETFQTVLSPSPLSIRSHFTFRSQNCTFQALFYGKFM